MTTFVSAFLCNPKCVFKRVCSNVVGSKHPVVIPKFDIRGCDFLVRMRILFFVGGVLSSSQPASRLMRVELPLAPSSSMWMIAPEGSATPGNDCRASRIVKSDRFLWSKKLSLAFADIFGKEPLGSARISF